MVKNVYTVKIQIKKEYVKDGCIIHINTIEGGFGSSQRGMKGILSTLSISTLKNVNRAVEIVANAFGKKLKYKEVLIA